MGWLGYASGKTLLTLTWLSWLSCLKWYFRQLKDNLRQLRHLSQVKARSVFPDVGCWLLDFVGRYLRAWGHLIKSVHIVGSWTSWATICECGAIWSNQFIISNQPVRAISKVQIAENLPVLHLLLPTSMGVWKRQWSNNHTLSPTCTQMLTNWVNLQPFASSPFPSFWPIPNLSNFNNLNVFHWP